MGDISVGVPRRGLVERLVNLKGLESAYWNSIKQIRTSFIDECPPDCSLQVAAVSL